MRSLTVLALTLPFLAAHAQISIRIPGFGSTANGSNFDAPFKPNEPITPRAEPCTTADSTTPLMYSGLGAQKVATENNVPNHKDLPPGLWYLGRDEFTPFEKNQRTPSPSALIGEKIPISMLQVATSPQTLNGNPFLTAGQQHFANEPEQLPAIKQRSADQNQFYPDTSNAANSPHRTPMEVGSMKMVSTKRDDSAIGSASMEQRLSQQQIMMDRNGQIPVVSVHDMQQKSFMENERASTDFLSGKSANQDLFAVDTLKSGQPGQKPSMDLGQAVQKGPFRGTPTNEAPVESSSCTGSLSMTVPAQRQEEQEKFSTISSQTPSSPIEQSSSETEKRASSFQQELVKQQRLNLSIPISSDSSKRRADNNATSTEFESIISRNDSLSNVSAPEILTESQTVRQNSSLYGTSMPLQNFTRGNSLSENNALKLATNWLSENITSPMVAQQQSITSAPMPETSTSQASIQHQYPGNSTGNLTSQPSISPQFATDAHLLGNLTSQFSAMQQTSENKMIAETPIPFGALHQTENDTVIGKSNAIASSQKQELMGTNSTQTAMMPSQHQSIKDVSTPEIPAQHNSTSQLVNASTSTLTAQKTGSPLETIGSVQPFTGIESNRMLFSNVSLLKNESLPSTLSNERGNNVNNSSIKNGTVTVDMNNVPMMRQLLQDLSQLIKETVNASDSNSSMDKLENVPGVIEGNESNSSFPYTAKKTDGTVPLLTDIEGNQNKSSFPYIAKKINGTIPSVLDIDYKQSFVPTDGISESASIQPFLPDMNTFAAANVTGATDSVKQPQSESEYTTSTDAPKQLKSPVIKFGAKADITENGVKNSVLDVKRNYPIDNSPFIASALEETHMQEIAVPEGVSPEMSITAVESPALTFVSALAPPQPILVSNFGLTPADFGLTPSQMEGLVEIAPSVWVEGPSTPTRHPKKTFSPKQTKGKNADNNRDISDADDDDWTSEGGPLSSDEVNEDDDFSEFLRLDSEDSSDTQFTNGTKKNHGPGKLRESPPPTKKLTKKPSNATAIRTEIPKLHFNASHSPHLSDTKVKNSTKTSVADSPINNSTKPVSGSLLEGVTITDNDIQELLNKLKDKPTPKKQVNRRVALYQPQSQESPYSNPDMIVDITGIGKVDLSEKYGAKDARNKELLYK